MRIAPLLLLALLAACDAHSNTATIPVPKEGAWLLRHEGFVTEARRGGIDVLFLGDSITDLWRNDGRALWEEHFAPLHAANFGINGDRTQHLLWRLEHRTLEGLATRVVVLLIGTNNLGVERNTGLARNSTTEAVEGITQVVRTLREKLPEANILLLGVLPRGEMDSATRAQVTAVNQALARLHDGRRIHFLDIGPRFLSCDGTLSKELMPDLLHLSEAGYAIWAAAIKEPLAKLLELQPSP